MHRLTACAASLAAFIVLAASALAAQPPANPAPSSPLQIKPPAPVEKVVATVGDAKITNTEVDDMIRSQLRGQPVPPEMMDRIRKSILQSMINSQLITQFVAAKNIKADTKDVDEAIASIKKRLAEQGADLPMLLQARGMTEDDLRSQIGDDMAVEKFLKTAVTDQQAEEYFKAHKKEFDGTRVRASHILLPYDEKTTPEQKKAANDKIASIRQEIVGGADFGEAAKKHSSCPSKENGGDLDFFARHGQMVEPFAAAAFTLETGGISQPVETQFGVHLIKVTDVEPGKLPFADAKEGVLQTLYQEALEKVAEEQRKTTKVEVIGF